jgi:hypothetical protein
LPAQPTVGGFTEFATELTRRPETASDSDSNRSRCGADPDGHRRSDGAAGSLSPFGIAKPDVVPSGFGQPLGRVGHIHPRVGPTDDARAGALGRDSKGRFHTKRTDPFTGNVHLVALILANDAPAGKVLAILKQQMVPAATDLADGALDRFITGKSSAMFHDMKRVATVSGDPIDRCASNDHLIARGAGTGDASITVGKMNGGSIPRIDAVMLKRHRAVLPPNKKMIPSGHPVTPVSIQSLVPSRVPLP